MTIYVGKTTQILKIDAELDSGFTCLPQALIPSPCMHIYITFPYSTIKWKTVTRATFKSPGSFAISIKQ